MRTLNTEELKLVYGGHGCHPGKGHAYGKDKCKPQTKHDNHCRSKSKSKSQSKSRSKSGHCY